MKNVDFSNVKITGGFWKEKQDLIRNVTVNAVYDRFYGTGRFDAFKFDKNSPIKPHFFWDSDVAKWIEGVAYLTSEKREPQLEKIVDDLVDLIEKNQDECGYFNIFHTVVEPQNRFKIRDHHELYCAGHLMEAGIAYYRATGKRKLLDLMCKYADYIEKRFKIDKDTDFVTPGHEEIELALVKMYEETGKKRYIELSKFFIDERGQRLEGLNDWANESYLQSHKPVREQFEAEGHAVRAAYLYCAMADLALRYNDEELKNACEKIFDDIANHKMYITGGIGSSSAGESFSIPYDLPNLIAYTESCAAIGLILFAHRMLLLTNDVKYSSVIERALYNGFLSSFSLDGKGFFYCNPLEIIPNLHKRDACTTHKTLNMSVTQRQEVFECSCCPPNIVRFVPSIGNYLYTYDQNAIYVHQFMESTAEINGVTIEQKTNYPLDGKIDIKVSGRDIKLYVRIPDFTDTYKGKIENGYAIFNVKNGETVALNFEMKPQLIEANPLVTFDSGKVAVMRGPIVYCLEEVDNGKNLRDIRIDKNGKFTQIIDTDLGTLCLEIDAYRRKPTTALYAPISNERIKIKAKLIPYYTFANRGESEMTVWCLAE